jgi:hypothetical protein
MFVPLAQPFRAYVFVFRRTGRHGPSTRVQAAKPPSTQIAAPVT